MLSRHNIALIGDGILPTDLNSFFGPIETTDDIATFRKGVSFAEVLMHFKFFSSKSDARRNGWDKPIPLGYSEHKIGKLRRGLYILNVPDMLPEEPDEANPPMLQA